MPTSASPSPTERRPRARDDAVSEVVGFMLIFGILSIVLVLSMVAFNAVHARAEASVVALEAESVAQRVAASAVDAALFAEGNSVGSSTYLHPLDLPEDLEGMSYRVHLETVLGIEQVRVEVDSIGLEATAPLFSAGAATTFTICDSDALGGAIRVRFAQNPTDPAAYCVFIEANT